MNREEPLFKKCCLCIPLKTFIIIWAILKTIGLSIAVAYLIFMTIVLSQYNSYMFIIQMVPLMILLVIDCCALTYLIIATCMSSFKLIKGYYYYHICFIIVEVLTLCIILTTTIEPGDIVQATEWYYLLCGFIIYIGLEIAILFTVQSEMLKLRNKEQYSFAKISSNVSDIEEIAQ